MPKFFATIVYVIDAEDAETAHSWAEQLVESPDCPEYIESAWVDTVEAVEGIADEDSDPDPTNCDDQNNG